MGVDSGSKSQTRRCVAFKLLMFTIFSCSPTHQAACNQRDLADGVTQINLHELPHARAVGYATDAAGTASSTSTAAGDEASSEGVANVVTGRTLRAARDYRFRFHRLFGSGATLSRSGAVVVGFSAPYKEVTATLTRGGRVVASGHSNADSTGRWHVSLGKPRAGTGFTLTAKRGGAKIASHDIQVGELWLVAGQSNVVLSLGDIATFGAGQRWGALATSEINLSGKAKTSSQIRIYKIPVKSGNAAQSDLPTIGTDFDGIHKAVFYSRGAWARLDSNSARTSSALGVLLAKQLRAKLQVPVGIIQAAMDGAGIVRFLPPDVWRRLPVPIANGRAKTSNLWNTMIAPLAATRLSGVVWYQGESDRLSGQDPYQAALTALITSWRSRLRQPRLRFEIVQLPPFFDTRFGLIRAAQKQVAAHMSNVGLVSSASVDTNGGREIHPNDKWTQARGLAASILRNYGRRV